MPKPCTCKHRTKPVGHYAHNSACPRSPLGLDRRVLAAAHDPGAVLIRRGSCHDLEPVCDWSQRAVQKVLVNLAEHDPAALLGEPDGVHHEYAVYWHDGEPGADPNPGICDSGHYFSYVTAAMIAGERKLGQYGITWYTISTREHRTYPNGTEWSGAWRKLALPEMIWKDF